MKRKLILYILMAVLLFLSPTSAFADTTLPVDNPNAHLAKVETFERISWQILPTLNGISPLASGCKTYTLGVNGYSAAGVQIWSYAWNIQWCYNGSTITSLKKWRTVWANYGWSFKGDIAENQSGGVGKSSYWHYAQGISVSLKRGPALHTLILGLIKLCMAAAVTAAVLEETNMLYAYLSLIPIAVGGVAAFLKGRQWWFRIIGLMLFGVALLGLLILPAVTRQAQ